MREAAARPALWVTNTEWVKRHTMARLRMNRLAMYDRFYFVVLYGTNHWVYVRANLRTGAMFWVDNQFNPATNVDDLERDIGGPLKEFIADVWRWAAPDGATQWDPAPIMSRLQIWAACSNGAPGVPQLNDGASCGTFMQAAMRVDMAQPPGCTDDGALVFARIRSLPGAGATKFNLVHVRLYRGVPK